MTLGHSTVAQATMQGHNGIHCLLPPAAAKGAGLHYNRRGAPTGLLDSEVQDFRSNNTQIRVESAKLGYDSDHRQAGTCRCHPALNPRSSHAKRMGAGGSLVA